MGGKGGRGPFRERPPCPLPNRLVRVVTSPISSSRRGCAAKPSPGRPSPVRVAVVPSPGRPSLLRGRKVTGAARRGSCFRGACVPGGFWLAGADSRPRFSGLPAGAANKILLAASAAGLRLLYAAAGEADSGAEPPCRRPAAGGACLRWRRGGHWASKGTAGAPKALRFDTGALAAGLSCRPDPCCRSSRPVNGGCLLPSVSVDGRRPSSIRFSGWKKAAELRKLHSPQSLSITAESSSGHNAAADAELRGRALLWAWQTPSPRARFRSEGSGP